MHTYTHTGNKNRQTDGQTDVGTDERAAIQTERQAVRQTKSQANMHTFAYIYTSYYFSKCYPVS